MRTAPHLTTSLILLWTVILFLPGCSGSQGIVPGFVTRYIEGSVTAGKPEDAVKPFILVQKFHKTFMESSRGRIYRSGLSISYPDKDGKYSVYLEDEVDRVELQFYAQNHKVQFYQYQRSLGIGKFQQDVALKFDSNWRNNYYFMIKPVLAGYIIEERYKLPDRDQKHLSDWMIAVELDMQKIKPKNNKNLE